MKSKISVLSNNEIIEILNTSKSFREVLTKIGYNTNGSGAYRTVKTECEKRKIKIPKYNYFGDGQKKNKKLDNEQVFSENSTYSRQHLKERIIKENLIEYKCSGCGLGEEWNGKKLSLQLEHKNGINNDNRLENLTFMCPNCHSQTTSYGGKSLKKQHLCECGNKKSKKSKMCFMCKCKTQEKTKKPEYKILIKEIKELGYTGTGRKYSVSDNTIRKWKNNFEK